MSKRMVFARVGVVCCFLAGLLTERGPSARAQDGKAPEWKHGIEFRVRKAGEPDFTKNTKKFGVETFADRNGNSLVYISETGSLAALPLGASPLGTESKTPKWLHALELRVRKAGEADFTRDTKKFGVEVFKDENTGNLAYISQTGDIAVTRGGPSLIAGPEAKAPKWLHGLELKVRKGGEADFNKDTKRYGIEVFKDENTNNLVYISETGAIAVHPAGSIASGQPKAPVWLHGLEFKVRKAGEADFTTKTRNHGAEIFKDDNVNTLVFITEAGFLAVAAAGSAASGETKAPQWLVGLELKCRKAGEADFSKDTQKFGAELFKDVNTGNLVYISETGSLAVPPVK